MCAGGSFRPCATRTVGRRRWCRVWSTSSATTTRVHGLREGADDYLTKPCDPAELVARVHVGLRVMGLQRSLSARVTQLEAALSRIHNLEQLLPICATCRRIKSGEGWHEVEGFLSSSAGVRFSHGACPKCAESWLAEAGLKA